MFMSLLVVPALFGAALLFTKSQRILAPVARLGAAAVIAVSVVFCLGNFNTIVEVDLSGMPGLKYVLLLIEAAAAAYLIEVGLTKKSTPLVVMAAMQFLLLAGYELMHAGEPVAVTFYIDKLSLLMILIVGVIGGLICLYAVEYMKDYHRHHPEVADRRGFFFTVLFVFLTAMFGLVTANDLVLLLFFWELTSLASFLLIGYTGKAAAVRNSLTAITVNMFGGLLFTVGVIVLGVFCDVGDFHGLLAHMETPVVGLAVFLLSCAALTKSAQMPFSRWLLGAMVAPTPTSAMLHSSTMVKAGVYLLLRLAPMLGDNAAGVTVTMIGGVTFFAAALIAVSQTDAKLVLAYSTISNLGLIVACTGINTAESLWAAMMLIVFHAIAKSLLFLTVGSTEYQLDSRNIEEMDGLFRISPSLTFLLLIGIAGMFIAPFGMLVSKWAAMKAFLESDNMFIVLLVAFGSTVTLFYWTKWMGKLIANVHRAPPTPYIMRIDEKISLYSLSALVVVACLLHPLISRYFLIPYIDSNMYIDFVSPIDAIDSRLIIAMMLMIFLIPLVLMVVVRKWPDERSAIYMSGLDVDGNVRGTAGAEPVRRMMLRNWYLRGMFGEEMLLHKTILLGTMILLAGFFAVMGGIMA